MLLDAGMATRLDSRDRSCMAGLFESFSKMDGEGVADWILAFSGEEQACSDPGRFIADSREYFDGLNDIWSSTPRGSSNGADALAGLLELVRTHGVSLPGHISATVVATLVLEGWSHELDPSHSAMSEVKRIIAARQGGIKGLIAQVDALELGRDLTVHAPPEIEGWDMHPDGLLSILSGHGHRHRMAVAV